MSDMTMIPSLSKRNPILTTDYIRYTPEGQYLERKSIGDCESQPAKIANELIGMLNADGGVLVLGISDDGKNVDDLRELDDLLLNRYRKLFFEFIKPPANIKLEEIELETGELIFFYHVDYEYERIFKRADNEAVYLRMADDNKGPLDLDQIRRLEYDRNIRSFENEIQTDFNYEDINERALRYYKNRINFHGTYTELLKARNLAEEVDGDIKYRKSAVLLFAKDPDKYIPNAKVRYIRYDGNKQMVGSEYNAIKDEVFYDGIPRMIEVVKRFIKVMLRDYFFLDMKTGTFNNIAEYPEEAWLEGIVNALTHRSYNLQGNPVYIKHFDNRLEVSNSGPLPEQVTVENIKTKRYSRNPRIARVLYEMGYVRELNEGVNRIYESMEKSMLSIPRYTDIDNVVTLILKNKISNNKKTITTVVMNKITRNWKNFNITERNIIRYLFVRGEGTISDIEAELELSSKTIRDYINNFVTLGVLDRLSEKQRDPKAKYTFVNN